MAGPRWAVVWSPEAEADLADIWSYYRETAGRQVADTVVRSVGEICRMLEEHPRAGRARDEIRPGLRSVVSRPYVVFYRFVATLPRSCVSSMGRDLDEIFSDDD
jgi:toxin ParE1/3/4